MQVDIVSQIPSDGIRYTRVGDILREELSSPWCEQFTFAVAYMRVSGISRIRDAIDSCINRGGTVAGSVGVDGVTSYDALKMLQEVSDESTIFGTTSFTYHPKVYLLSGDDNATAIIGSANLTRDGLFRNIEFATKIVFDLSEPHDLTLYDEIETNLESLRDIRNPNIHAISDALLDQLLTDDIISTETRFDRNISETANPKRSVKIRNLSTLFPPISVYNVPTPTPQTMFATPSIAGVRTQSISSGASFILQLSSFDSSHRTNVRGTPEILIPLDAESFFPPLTKGANYFECFFDVNVEYPTGSALENCRLWYYDSRHELRLRLVKPIIDLTTIGGGDILVLQRAATAPQYEFELTIHKETDSSFQLFLNMCTMESQGKRWTIT